MFCKSCGKEIPDDSTFCNYCGNRQIETNQELKRKRVISVETVDCIGRIFSMNKEILEEINQYLSSRFEKYRIGSKYNEHHVSEMDGVFHLSIGSNELFIMAARRHISDFLLQNGFVRTPNDTFDKVIEV